MQIENQASNSDRPRSLSRKSQNGRIDVPRHQGNVLVESSRRQVLSRRFLRLGRGPNRQSSGWLRLLRERPRTRWGSRFDREGEGCGCQKEAAGETGQMFPERNSGVRCCAIVKGWSLAHDDVAESGWERSFEQTLFFRPWPASAGLPFTARQSRPTLQIFSSNEEKMEDSDWGSFESSVRLNRKSLFLLAEKFLDGCG